MSADKDSAAQVFYIGIGRMVTCLDKASGDIVWQTALEGSLSSATIVLDDDRIIAAGHRRAACLDRATGEIRWQTKVKGLSAPTSIALDKSVPGGQLILACPGLLFSLWAETGELLWENGLEGYGYGSICMRVPGAIVAQPISRVVSSGNSSRIEVLQNDQYDG